MREKIRQRLIAALNSGEYRQGTGALKYIDSDGIPCYCAAGVLCDLYEKATRGRAGKYLLGRLENLHPSDEIYQTLPAGAKAIFSICSSEMSTALTTSGSVRARVPIACQWICFNR